MVILWYCVSIIKIIFKVNKKVQLMIIDRALKIIAPFVPIAGSAYGFGKTCVKIYNATSPTKALIVGIKTIFIDCTPPVIKYPLLCRAALTSSGAACLTGDPNFAVGFFECCSAIVEV
jgi:hypothetical protein